MRIIVSLVRVFVALVLAGVAVSIVSVGVSSKAGAAGAFVIAALFGVAAFFAWPKGSRSWRDGRPSVKQLSFAKDLGIAVPRKATKGEVSDMISSVTGR